MNNPFPISKTIFLSILMGFTIVNAHAQQDSVQEMIQTWDSVNKVTYRVSAGGLMFTPSVNDNIDVAGYSIGFTQDDTRMTSIMHNSQGFIIRNEIHLDLKENPVSFSADLAYGLGNFNMLEFDEFGNQISHTWFRKISLTTIGLGLDIGGKYFNFGAKYRIGNCFGGYHQEPLPYVPGIVRDNQLNLKTNMYHGLEFSVGAQYKDLFIKFRRVHALTKPIYLTTGLYTGLFSTSVEIGYVLNFDK